MYVWDKVWLFSGKVEARAAVETISKDINVWGSER